MGAANSEATWDAHAARYSSQERLEAHAISAALRLAEPGPSDGLVDLATGTGAVLRALAQRRPRPAAAVGVDRSANMLSRVGALPEGWRTVQGDATEHQLSLLDVVPACVGSMQIAGPGPLANHDRSDRARGPNCSALVTRSEEPVNRPGGNRV
jgi:SAM-dependent methyltransferase